MGQYWIVVNLDKKEFLRPHHCGDGAKLLEFGCSSNGTMTALAVLLATSNGKGGGDLFDDRDGVSALDPIIGRWKGDRIAVVGDYDASNQFGNIYGPAGKDEDGWVDISFAAMEVLMRDRYIRTEVLKNEWYRNIWNQKHPEQKQFPQKD